MSQELTGEGVESNPYVIETVADFLAAEDPDAHYKLKSTLDFADYAPDESNEEKETHTDGEKENAGSSNTKYKYVAAGVVTVGIYVYTQSLSLAIFGLIGVGVASYLISDDPDSTNKKKYLGKGFIGTDSKHSKFVGGEEFTGTFNGGGNVIKNGTFTEEGESGGLFNEIGEGGIVYDLRVSGFEMEGDADLGVIAGENHGTIGFVSVSDSEVVARDEAGVIVARNNEGTIARCVVENCAVSAEHLSGGFCGGNKGYIIESEAMGVDIGVTKGNNICGGFVGTNYRSSLIIDCRAEGTVTAKETDDGKSYTGEFAGLNGKSMAHTTGDGVILHSFASVSGCKHGFTLKSQFPILNCYYNKDLCEGDAYYTTRWIHDLPVRGLSESEMTGEDALSNMDWLFDDVWTHTSDYPRPQSLEQLDEYWEVAADVNKPMGPSFVDAKWLTSVEEWAKQTHETALESPAANNNIPGKGTSNRSSTSRRKTNTNSNTSSRSNSNSEKVAIKSTGSLLSSGSTLGYIEGNIIRGAGGLLSRGDIVAELDGNTVRDTSGLLTRGDRIAEIHGDEVRDIGGLLSSGNILAVIDGNEIRDKGGILTSGEVLATIDGNATQNQKGAAAAAIALGKIKE